MDDKNNKRLEELERREREGQPLSPQEKDEINRLRQDHDSKPEDQRN